MTCVLCVVLMTCINVCVLAALWLRSGAFWPDPLTTQHNAAQRSPQRRQNRTSQPQRTQRSTN